ncbi:hypothetical protein AG4045_010968 [Apium graveolens]|uniref:Uncharacterized protein n=1 Tax=Apium graveolens TaxID=4045 RepID=A0A6L5BAL7_APIGR|nr:hypothetical protein AG4045_010968 [Apium graveolens]
MALPAAPLQYSFCSLSRAQTVTSDRLLLLQPILIRSVSSNRRCLRVFATETTSGKQKAQPGEDTRIHWESEDEGWIGGSYKKRRFYDWTLAQETASREAEKMRIKFEDPYIQQLRNFESVPDMVDRLGGKNLELSGQAKSALTFDILVILFSICCIAYVLIFKEPYY